MYRRNRDSTNRDNFIDLEKGEGIISRTRNDPQHEKYEHQQIKSSHVYVKDKAHGWLPGVLIDTDQKKDIATVLCNDPQSVHKIEVKVKLKDYGSSKSLPLQCLDSHGSMIVVDDMRDLPYSNEPSILYNLKERYEQQKTPYTRATGCVMVAINPYEWIQGLYAERLRREYANNIVWKANQTPHSLNPHLYEISSMALKGILADGEDQTIIVSGESGSGKTVSSKILMAHLATFHELKRAYITQEQVSTIRLNEIKKTTVIKKQEKERSVEKSILEILKDSCYHYISTFMKKSEDTEQRNNNIPCNLTNENSFESEPFFDMEAPPPVMDEGPEELKQKNLIVQRVIDSNPLLEAFGNAKTFLNDNSSRFSRYSKLQFHVKDGVIHPMANIAGSICHTFLLEKSRVVTHDYNNERTFHIFYQLLAASEEEKCKIWKGLKGKTVSSFKYMGTGGIDEFTNRSAWKNTISALNTIGVVGEDLQTILSAVCIVLQLGNIVFVPNPRNEEESIISNKNELKILSEIIGIPSKDLSHCLTHKTMKAVHDTYQVPLKAVDAKSTCDAFAKDCYRALFKWLVNKTNDSTCADKNYVDANRVSQYNCIAILDICGFESFDKNGFEQLLINHANERLQKTFTETIIDSVIEEYDRDGVFLENIEHENNDTVIRFLEGKMGLMSLLNEECIRPQGSDSTFVNKMYATHSTTSKSSKLIFHRHYQLSKTLFGIKHFAKDVTYDASGFLMKNKDTLSYDVVRCALKSTNDIIRDGIKPNESVGPRKKRALTGTSMWSSFEKQMTALFKQTKQTRIWYVRCIIPNNQKKPFLLDLKCALTQLRSVGLLTALKMSHASFPNKQRFDYILRRFWTLGNFCKKYEFGNVEGSEADIRHDCEELLKNVFNKSQEFSDSFVVGLTKVYFRSGSLEELELKRARAFDRSASKIQARMRGIIARKNYKVIRAQSALERQIMRKRKATLYRYLIPCAILPLYLLRYMFGSVRRSRKAFYRGSWH